MIDHHGLCLGTPCSCDTVTGPVPVVANTLTEPRHIGVNEVLVLPNVPAGMNPYVVMSLTYLFRSTSQDVEPIKVMREGSFYRIIDGRHRYIASLMAGRATILAQEA